MRHTGALSTHEHLELSTQPKHTLAKIAQWTLYVAGGLALIFGLLVWPGQYRQLGGIHGLAGWLVIASLWTLSASAARSGVSRSNVWLAVAWGALTTIGAMAQYELRPGSWITVLHVATGIGAIAWGQQLVMRMRHGEAAVVSHPETATRGSELTIKDAAAAFLAKKRIAVTGVSRKSQEHGANIVYKRLRERGYQVFAINPNATAVEGDPSFKDLASIPGGVDAVVIGTRADRAMEAMRECEALGIDQVWMHRSVGAGSVSEEAALWGRQHGMRVIAGGCPLMFEPVSDPGHKIMRSVLTLTGKVPRHA